MAQAMKDSGIEWIGEIPEGWKVNRHKYIMHKEKSLCEKYNGEDIISLTMGGVIVRDLEAGGKMPTSFDGYQYVEPGDLLQCLFDIDVTPRCVGLVKSFGVTSPAYSRFKVHEGFSNAYYDYLLRTIDDEKVFVSDFETASRITLDILSMATRVNDTFIIVSSIVPLTPYFDYSCT